MNYGIAIKLKGFRTDTLRVRIDRREPGLVWVTTADLLDVGTKLVLDEGQVLPEQPARVYKLRRPHVRRLAPLAALFLVAACVPRPQPLERITDHDRAALVALIERIDGRHR